MRLSVIIPLAPGEQAWKALWPDLAALPPGSEIILAWPQGTPATGAVPPSAHVRVREIGMGQGRAAQMNAAARLAAEEQLWFVHADSRLSPSAIPRLLARIRETPGALLYCDLRFLHDATPLMRINEWGVWFRSRVLGMPFGDQGFCLRQDRFLDLRGYPEDVACGEDHVFVWRARQHGVRLRPVGAPLYTSARKYRENGWLKTTARHLLLTCSQAWGEVRRLFRQRGAA